MTIERFRLAAVVVAGLVIAGCASLDEGRTRAAGSGYVAYVSPYRIVTDLAARDGVKPGSLLSIRRDRIRIVHPVTGKLLGELDEEIGIAKVIDVQEQFSVAEVLSPPSGHTIQIKDRVVPLPQSTRRRPDFPTFN